MHDLVERPRFRWRRLAWVGIAFIFLPIFYVAMVGPVHWWLDWHPGPHPLVAQYIRSLDPFEFTPSTSYRFEKYCDWWRKRPPPLSWQRAELA